MHTFLSSSESSPELSGLVLLFLVLGVDQTRLLRLGGLRSRPPPDGGGGGAPEEAADDILGRSKPS